MLRRRHRPNFEGIETVIAENTIINGEVISQGSVRIDGCIEGCIRAEGDLIIGEKGRITGNIEARNLLIAGWLSGNCQVTGKAHITPTGVVAGDITSTTLVVEEGGLFQGCSIMPNKGDDAAARSLK